MLVVPAAETDLVWLTSAGNEAAGAASSLNWERSAAALFLLSPASAGLASYQPHCSAKGRPRPVWLRLTNHSLAHQVHRVPRLRFCFCNLCSGPDSCVSVWLTCLWPITSRVSCSRSSRCCHGLKVGDVDIWASLRAESSFPASCCSCAAPSRPHHLGVRSREPQHTTFSCCGEMSPGQKVSG